MVGNLEKRKQLDRTGNPVTWAVSPSAEMGHMSRKIKGHFAQKLMRPVLH